MRGVIVPPSKLIVTNICSPQGGVSYYGGFLIKGGDYIYIYIYMMYLSPSLSLSIYISIYIYISLYIYIYLSLSMSLSLYIYICVYIYIYMYTYIYIYIYIHYTYTWKVEKTAVYARIPACEHLLLRAAEYSLKPMHVALYSSTHTHTLKHTYTIHLHITCMQAHSHQLHALAQRATHKGSFPVLGSRTSRLCLRAESYSRGVTSSKAGPQVSTSSSMRDNSPPAQQPTWTPVLFICCVPTSHNPLIYHHLSLSLSLSLSPHTFCYLSALYVCVCIWDLRATKQWRFHYRILN